MPEAKAISDREFFITFSYLAILSLGSTILIWTVLGVDKRMEDSYNWMLVIAAGLSFGIAAGSTSVIIKKLFKCEAETITERKFLKAVSFLAILGIVSASLIQIVLGLDKSMEDACRWMLYIAAGLSYGIIGGSMAMIAIIVRKLLKCDD